MLGIPQGELLRRMTSAEIAEQMAYDLIAREGADGGTRATEEASQFGLASQGDVTTARLLEWRARRRAGR